MLLACIADDFTGATDLANNLVRAGLRTLQTIGVPVDVSAALAIAQYDAIVVALKTRTIPVQDAIDQSLAALTWLQRCGATQIYFKYCSTFDSTPAGNIGPVTEALMDALDCDFTIACPAFPENGRSVFRGYLFVGDQLLSESGMRDHPLTPMCDANLVRVLQAQTKRKVGLIPYDCVAQGAVAIHERIAALKAEGVSIAIVDAVSDSDLLALGPALRQMPLITAGSGVAIGLAKNYLENISPVLQVQQQRLPRHGGLRAILAGSCSIATNAQVSYWQASGGAAYEIDVLALATDALNVDGVMRWALTELMQAPILIYATTDAQRLAQIQDQLGASHAGALVEQTMAKLAQLLVAAGVTQLVVAGGETAGAVVQALGIQALQIGPQIDPGVPWTAVVGGPGLLLALKSGNFGTKDFFTKCFTQLDYYERNTIT
jgi:uncharacterized protein YgbK (DUF1537 family)